MSKKKKKPYETVLITGAISIASFYLLLTNLSIITDYFTRGGYYAALPIVTVFYISLIYGAFASSVISILGIEPARSTH